MTRPPEKKQTLLACLDRGIAMVHVDARRPGVKVPLEFAEEPHLRLNLSYRFQIPDLEVTDSGVQATLSFRGQHFHCNLPWSAVFGITSQLTGDGQVWPEDLPIEVGGHLGDSDDGAFALPGTAADPGKPFSEPDAAPVPQRGLRLAGGGRRQRPERKQRAALAAVESEPDAPGGPELVQSEPATSGAGTGAPAQRSDEAPLAPAPLGDGPPGEVPAQPAPSRGHLRLVR